MLIVEEPTVPLVPNGPGDQDSNAIEHLFLSPVTILALEDEQSEKVASLAGTTVERPHQAKERFQIMLL